MYLSLNWLKDFVTFKQTPEQVAEILTLGGFEVEKIEHKGRDLEGIIVGQIKTIVSHAEADKLVVCKVDVGRKELLKIVCGARNIKPGHKVPVAIVGVTLPNGLKIERRRIRGVDSEGMLCAEDELGLGEDHEGILILDKDVRIGQKLNKVLGLDDIVLDIAVSSNRADGFSVYGLAAEFAALSGQKLIEKKVIVPESKKVAVSKSLTVKVQDYDLCSKYTARVVKNVKIKPSPQWLQSRLRVCGVKPVNNIVDITNYVMLERGQPLHAFDLAKVNGKKVVVRKAGQEKKFISLDGEERVLTSDMLMIASAQESIAIAGVMGGQNSEISRQTRDIVIESAIFKPISIRKTRQKLGLVTEASTRFEKGIWWNLPEWASNRAAQLMSEMAGGEVAQGMIVASQPKQLKPTAVKVKKDYISNLIGRKFSIGEIKQSLERLHFKVAADKDELEISVPLWRQDIKIPADIAEEVGRMYGWNNLKPMPIFSELKPALLPKEKYWERSIKNILTACGMTETLNYSFYSGSLLEQFSLDVKNHYQVTNPLNPEQEYLRTSLIPRLFDNIMKNYQTREQVKLFEIGKIFQKTSKEMPDEQVMVSGIIYQKKGDISCLVGVINNLFRQLGITWLQSEAKAGKGLASLIDIIINKDRVGEYGLIKSATGKLGNPPAYFEVNLSEIVKHIAEEKKYKPILQFPAVEHDFTFIAPVDTVYSEVVKTIKNTDSLIIGFAGVGKPYKVSEQTRNITFKAVFQAQDRTLMADEIERVRQKIIKQAANKFNMELKH